MPKAKARGPSQVTVGRNALVARINRRIAENNERLLAARSARVKVEMGDYYIVNTKHGGVTRSNLDLVDFARELRCLQPWEALVEEE